MTKETAPVGRPKAPFDEETRAEIERLRKLLGLTKYKCAQLIGVSNTAYNRYEAEADNFIGAAKQQELLSMLQSTLNARKA